MTGHPHGELPSVASILVSQQDSSRNMDSGDEHHDSPEPPQASEPERPPGGTRRSGTKTPRKVQWVFDEQERPSDPSTSSRALDEYGFDVRLIFPQFH